MALPPVIITAHVEADDIEPFDRLREEHFPPARNFLKAHVTVFHHLPGQRLVAVREIVSEALAARRSFAATVSGLQQSLGKFDAFTENRTAREWMAFLFETTHKALEAGGHHAPDFETFWEQGELRLPLRPDEGGPANAFRQDPSAFPLQTPSGRIEIFSQTIDGFGYDDCRGHPHWYPARSRSKPDQSSYPLHLVCNQPHQRLHSQLDYGDFSRSTKIKGREPVRINSADAAARGIADGDIVRLFNGRGSCLAAAVLSEDVRSGVMQLATGAWFEPDDREAENAMCIHGNPNILTHDVGTSKLAQGCTGQITKVDVERFSGELPPVRIFERMTFAR